LKIERQTANHLRLRPGPLNTIYYHDGDLTQQQARNRRSRCTTLSGHKHFAFSPWGTHMLLVILQPQTDNEAQVQGLYTQNRL
jgi:hypothetical protein